MKTSLRRPKVSKIALKETHTSGLTFEIREAIAGGDRIYIDMGGNSYTSIGISLRELIPMVNFLKRVVKQLEILTEGKVK
jgi:hypothetical protein